MSRRTIDACTACGLLVHMPDGCHPQPLGDLVALPCPACGHRAVYSTGIDRYIHTDSRRPNAPCWLRCVQGNTDEIVQRSNERRLAARR